MHIDQDQPATMLDLGSLKPSSPDTDTFPWMDSLQGEGNQAPQPSILMKTSLAPRGTMSSRSFVAEEQAMSTADTLISRARSALDLPTLYMLSKGGRRPDRPYPNGKDYVDLAENTSDPVIQAYREKARAHGYDPDKLGPLPVCDCSGFIWWVLGEARGNRNTDWIHHDALYAGMRFQVVSTGHEFRGRPGDVLVYAHHDQTAHGHVGLITEVMGGAAEGPASRVIHCSAGNMELPPRDGEIYPSGIAESGVEVFRAHHNPDYPAWSTLVCRPWMLWG